MFNRRLEERLRRLEEKMASIDSAIAAYAAEVENTFTTIGTDISNVAGGVQALQNEIKNLQAQIGTTVLSPNAQATLNKLVLDSANIEASLKAIDTSVPVAPTQGS